jgi:hypothetical protein
MCRYQPLKAEEAALRQEAATLQKRVATEEVRVSWGKSMTSVNRRCKCPRHRNSQGAKQDARRHHVP